MGRGLSGYFTLFHYAVTVGLWIFVILHAVNMDITHDEAYSFWLVKTAHLRMMAGTANTHWLNSLFMKLCSLLFGDEPVALRLHSMIAFPFFAFAIFRLTQLLKNPFLQLACYCLVLFNPYILDFFSLARGYALALTFQAWLLVTLANISRRKDGNSGEWMRAVVLCALMVSANLSYLYSVAGAIILLLLFMAFFRKKGYGWNERKIRIAVLCFAILCLFTCADLLVIKNFGRDLNYGPHSDPIRSMIGSVVKGSFYFVETPGIIHIITYTVAALLVLSSFCIVISSIRRRTITTSFAPGLVCICILSAALLLYFIIDMALPYNRTALQWYVPGIFLICSAIDEKLLTRKIAAPFAGAVSLVMIIHFARHGSSYYSYEWRWNQGIHSIFDDAKDLHARRLLLHHTAGGVYYNYYSITDKDLLRIPVTILPGTDDQEQLTRLLQKDDYIVCPTGWEGNVRKAGKSFTMERSYPHCDYRLIRIDQ